MALSLKISNVIGNELELLRRLRGIQTPGKKILVEAIRNSDYKTIYKELLWRIELYASLKVLNYPKADVVKIATGIYQIGLSKMVELTFEKYAAEEVMVMQLNESCKESCDENNLEEGSEQYQKFFNEKLEKYGIESPADLDDDEKKEFFNEIEKEWTGDQLNESAVESKPKKFVFKKTDIFLNTGEKVGDIIKDSNEYVARIMVESPEASKPFKTIEVKKNFKFDFDLKNYLNLMFNRFNSNYGFYAMN